MIYSVSGPKKNMPACTNELLRLMMNFQLCYALEGEAGVHRSATAFVRTGGLCLGLRAEAWSSGTSTHSYLRG